jgi:hypothetical protein
MPKRGLIVPDGKIGRTALSRQPYLNQGDI